MQQKTRIILATVASLELVIFSVMILIQSLKEYKLEAWFIAMGVVGVSGIFLAARSEFRSTPNQ
ncbi:MAG: hypothetical protein AAFN10_18200 [Bacteroidota bacterium]